MLFCGSLLLPEEEVGFQVFSSFTPSQVLSWYIISTNTKPNNKRGNKERDIWKKHMHSTGKGSFSQMRLAIDKLIFLPFSFTGKLKLFVHHCL